MDIPFYDWHYFGVYLQTPMIPTDTHSHVLGNIIPQSTYVVRTGLEPVLAFGIDDIRPIFM